ncbi:MAG: ABC transporter ATP-binding protein [Candidatus Odinarchaeota archaeon]
MITLDDVTKNFDEVVAVSRLTARLKANSVTGLLGPNGAGKSTTLKLIMGEIKPSSGTIRVMGENPFDNYRIKQKIGYVSEYLDIYPWMAGRKLVQSLARLHMPREEASKAAAAALKMVGLNEEAVDRPTGSYSKGMKQRLKVAAAILHEPELLILDEPFGGLDPLGRREMKQLIKRLNDTAGVTILISSHILYEIEEMSTHMILIHRGQTIAEGKPAKIIEIIDAYPHSILFRGKQETLKRLAQELLEEEIVQTVNVLEPDNNSSQLDVITEKPSVFYKAVTRIVAENNIKIDHMESKTDNIEAIFEYLTQ